MRFVASIGAILLAVLLGPILGEGIHEWWYSEPKSFRLTIEVEAKGQHLKASSVISVRLSKKAPWAARGGVVGRPRGSAVLLEMPDKKNLIVPLYSVDERFPWGVDLLLVYAFELSPNWQLPEFWRAYRSLSGKRELHGSRFPPLASLDDLNDPRSLRIVTPESFEQVFGAGSRFLAATIEITDEAPKDELSPRLPWLADFVKSQPGSRTLPNGIVLHPSLFIR